MELKEYIKSETNGVIESNMFESVYSNFMNVVKYYTDKKKFSGIEEYIIPKLEMLANETIEKKEKLIDSYLSLCMTFEPYVKKVLFIVDRDRYENLAKSESNALVEYLKAVGYSVFVKAENRNKITDIIFKAHEFRNDKSHECENLKISQLYERIDIYICAYMLVAQKRNKDLKTIFGEPTSYLFAKDAPLDMDIFQEIDVRSVIHLLEMGKKKTTPGIKKQIKRYFKEPYRTDITYYEPDGTIRIESYDKDGKLIDESSSDQSQEECKLKVFDYLKNDNGEIIGAKYYYYDKLDNNQVFSIDKVTFEKEDGLIKIYNEKEDIETPGLHRPSRAHEKALYATFDEYGRPLDIGGVKYIYDGKDRLISIDKGRKYFNVEYSGNEMRFYRLTKRGEKAYTRKWYVIDGLVVKEVIYMNEINVEPSDSQEIVGEYETEYY